MAIQTSNKYRLAWGVKSTTPTTPKIYIDETAISNINLLNKTIDVPTVSGNYMRGNRVITCSQYIDSATIETCATPNIVYSFLSSLLGRTGTESTVTRNSKTYYNYQMSFNGDSTFVENKLWLDYPEYTYPVFSQGGISNLELKFSPDEVVKCIATFQGKNITREANSTTYSLGTRTYNVETIPTLVNSYLQITGFSPAVGTRKIDIEDATVTFLNGRVNVPTGGGYRVGDGGLIDCRIDIKNTKETDDFFTAYTKNDANFKVEAFIGGLGFAQADDGFLTIKSMQVSEYTQDKSFNTDVRESTTLVLAPNVAESGQASQIFANITTVTTGL